MGGGNESTRSSTGQLRQIAWTYERDFGSPDLETGGDLPTRTPTMAFNLTFESVSTRMDMQERMREVLRAAFILITKTIHGPGTGPTQESLPRGRDSIFDPKTGDFGGTRTKARTRLG